MFGLVEVCVWTTPYLVNSAMEKSELCHIWCSMTCAMFGKVALKSLDIQLTIISTLFFWSSLRRGMRHHRSHCGQDRHNVCLQRTSSHQLWCPKSYGHLSFFFPSLPFIRGPGRNHADKQACTINTFKCLIFWTVPYLLYSEVCQCWSSLKCANFGAVRMVPFLTDWFSAKLNCAVFRLVYECTFAKLYYANILVLEFLKSCIYKYINKRSGDEKLMLGDIRYYIIKVVTAWLHKCDARMSLSISFPSLLLLLFVTAFPTFYSKRLCLLVVIFC